MKLADGIVSNIPQFFSDDNMEDSFTEETPATPNQSSLCRGSESSDQSPGLLRVSLFATHAFQHIYYFVLHLTLSFS